MPQMFPLNWIMLFIYFFLIFILFNIQIYYFYNNKSSMKINKMNLKINNNKLIWKW